MFLPNEIVKKVHSEAPLPECDLCRTEDVLLTSDQGMQTDQVRNKDESLQTECYDGHMCFLLPGKHPFLFAPRNQGHFARSVCNSATKISY